MTPLKVAFDVGGVLSKYPAEMRNIMTAMAASGTIELWVITDMHDRPETLKQLEENGFGFVPEERVLNSDYATYGEFCKAVLLKEHGIGMLVDDFGGYVAWDSQLGPAPIRLQVMPDPFRPYWHPDWKESSGSDFGRRVCPQNLTAPPNQLPTIDLGKP